MSDTAPAFGIVPPGYRLPAATRPGSVALQVADIERSIAFYKDVLGMVVRARTKDSAELGGHGDERVLLRLRERPGAAPTPAQGRLGLYHFALLLPERAALGRFLVHAAELGLGLGAADHLVSEAVYLQDPDGLGIEIYADRERASWQSRDGQLLMATDPLDAESVIASAGGERWAGMPAGTVLGHVHLHVGDLRQAAAFYHEALGLDQVVWSYPGALFLSAGGYHHHLGLNTWARSARPAGETDARLLEWTMVLPAPADVAAALESLERAGHAAASNGSVVDPWGTRLRLRAATT